MVQAQLDCEAESLSKYQQLCDERQSGNEDLIRRIAELERANDELNTNVEKLEGEVNN